MCVDIHAQQAQTVGTYPDVTAAVACHTVDAVVHADTSQSVLITNRGVPLVGVLVIHHERALSVQPDVIHLVGKGLQRFAASQSVIGDIVRLPYGMLLVHDVAAHQSSVLIHEYGTVATFAD